MINWEERMIERKIREISCQQPITEMSVTPIGESLSKPEPDEGTRLQGKLIECAECHKHFLVPFGEFKKYPWKMFKQKDHVKTIYYFCTYTHKKQWQRAMAREEAKL